MGSAAADQNIAPGPALPLDGPARGNPQATPSEPPHPPDIHPTSTSHPPYTHPTSNLHPPEIHPTSTSHRPLIGPILTSQRPLAPNGRDSWVGARRLCASLDLSYAERTYVHRM